MPKFFLLHKIHTWEATKEVDVQHGYNVMTKHVVVEFLFKGISTLTLSDFNNQNVLFGLAREKTGEGFRLILDDCYGVAASLRPTNRNPVPLQFGQTLLR
jgi:hypothetical protein